MNYAIDMNDMFLFLLGVYAKQVVPHVHYHIIPKPDHRQREEYVKKFPVPEDAPAIYKAPFGLGVREELDEDIGKKLAEALRVEMAKITKELGGVEMIEGPISREKL